MVEKYKKTFALKFQRDNGVQSERTRLDRETDMHQDISIELPDAIVRLPLTLAFSPPYRFTDANPGPLFWLLRL